MDGKEVKGNEQRRKKKKERYIERKRVKEK